MNGASLLLAAFKWTPLGRVASLGPLVNEVSPVGGEEARGDSPSPSPGTAEAGGGERGRSAPRHFCLLTGITLHWSSSMLALYQSKSSSAAYTTPPPKKN